MASISHISLPSFFTLILLVNARLNLDRSDHEALLTIQKDLGIIHRQLHVRESPCYCAGIFCERRISNAAYVFRVTRIVFKSQQLKGFLSPAIGLLSELKELSLPNNHLVHHIPPQIAHCRNLKILNLQNNRLSGKVPLELSSLIRLRVLDLSSNKFSGNLSFLKYYPHLEKLSLADNMFTGKLPASLQSSRNLRFFNISGNSFLPSMNRVKYLSSELKEGNTIPKRFIVAENPTERSRTAMTPINKPSSWIFWLVGGLVGGALAGAAGAISGVVIWLFFKSILARAKGGGKDSGPAIFSLMIKKAEDLAFLEKEDGLASLEVIGRGGCGVVYKAELPGSNRKMIAIKKIIQPPRDAAELTEEESRFLNNKMRQIKSEIQIVGRIRHRNILPLLAHVSRPDCHYLIYEFMKNGSLQDMLTQVSQGTRYLDWLARHRIALGVAAGLEYLHINHSPRIIHRDLKPGNILLDDKMEARIADFGFAKAVPDAHTHITTSNVAGTVGYMAPEYHQTLKFTDKCDIYSFGVLLGILVIGKLPSDEFFQHTSEMSLVKWMRNVMTSEDPNRAIDPKLMENGFEDQMLQVLKIACFCTLDNPKERPNSKDVKCMLSQIKHQVCEEYSKVV